MLKQGLIVYTGSEWVKDLQRTTFLVFSRLGTNWPRYIQLLLVGGYLGVHLSVNAPVLAVGAGLIIAILAIGQGSFLRGLNLRYLVPLSCTVIFTGSVWLSAASPVHAAFFSDAEDFFTSAFPDVGDDVIPIVFNVLRGIFLIYVGIAFVGVVNGARNDEDWRQLARTPMIIVIAVAIADVVTGLIVDGAGEGGGDEPPADGA